MSTAYGLVNNDQIENPVPSTRLYHGSMFQQSELKPGFRHTGKLVNWDHYESNTYLYATEDEEMAKVLGFFSAIEKKFKVKRSRVDDKKKEISLEFEGPAPDVEKLKELPVFLYTIAPSPSEDWQKVKNPYNGIDTEWKTNKTVGETSIISCVQLDLQTFLAAYTINC